MNDHRNEMKMGAILPAARIDLDLKSNFNYGRRCIGREKWPKWLILAAESGLVAVKDVAPEIGYDVSACQRDDVKWLWSKFLYNDPVWRRAIV